MYSPYSSTGLNTILVGEGELLDGEMKVPDP